MEIHVLDVGCGSMAIILNPDGTKVVLDCNITKDNSKAVLTYVEKIFGKKTPIDVFINSHRDSDHMRGIADLNAQHPIQSIWDTDVPGTTTDSPEYLAYMKLKRTISNKEIGACTYEKFGEAKYRFMNAKQEDYTEANQQSVVLKIEYKTPECSVMFAGDTDYRPWKEKILTCYKDSDLQSALLIGAHHGSINFFNDPAGKENSYLEHIKKIKPAMTIVSVGPNQHGLPDKKALELYEKYSSGSNKGNKLYTTEEKQNMKITLKDDGGWSLDVNQ